MLYEAIIHQGRMLGDFHPGHRPLAYDFVCLDLILYVCL
jgi:hypothetical protein